MSEHRTYFTWLQPSLQTLYQRWHKEYLKTELLRETRIILLIKGSNEAVLPGQTLWVEWISSSMMCQNQDLSEIQRTPAQHLMWRFVKENDNLLHKKNKEHKRSYHKMKQKSKMNVQIMDQIIFISPVIPRLASSFHGMTDIRFLGLTIRQMFFNRLLINLCIE